MTRKQFRISFLLCIIPLAIILLTGCAQDQTVRHVVDTVEVKTPILERAEAPQELYRVKVDSIPRWVAPTDPAATACVTKSGEPMLKSIMLNRESLLDGWEAYGR